MADGPELKGFVTRSLCRPGLNDYKTNATPSKEPRNLETKKPSGCKIRKARAYRVHTETGDPIDLQTL